MTAKKYTINLKLNDLNILKYKYVHIIYFSYIYYINDKDSI